MNPYIACVKSYVAGWWMKLLAAAIVVCCVVGFFASWSESNSWEPAWSHPQLVGWRDVEGLTRPDRVQAGDIGNVGPAPSTNDKVPLEDVEGIVLDGIFDVRFKATEAPQLRYYRLENSSVDAREEHLEFQTKAAQNALASIADVASIDTVEIRGMIDAAALEPLRGSKSIRRLITSNLTISGGSNRPEPIGEMTALVEIVLSMPNLETWGPPEANWYLLQHVDETRIEQLRLHPSMTKLLVRPDNHQPPATSAWQSMSNLFPGKELVASQIHVNRFRAFWAVLVVAVSIANLAVAAMAGMLAVSSTPMLPRYGTVHRRTVCGLFAVVGLFSVLVLLAYSVALLPAFLVALLAVSIAGAMLDFDRRRPIAGGLIMPISFAPMVVILLPLSLRGRGQLWLWLDQFLAHNALQPITIGIALLGGYLFYLFWRSVPLYAASLSANGRENVVVATRGDTLKAFVKASSSSESRNLFGGPSIVPSHALATDNLSSPSTPEGRSQLIREGLFHMPPGKVILNVAIMAIVLPLTLIVMEPDFLAQPTRLVTLASPMLIAALWGFPLILWNERSSRIPQEIGTLLPRQQYIVALSTLLRKQLILPTVLTIIAVSVYILVQSGAVWPIPLVVAVAFGLKTIVASVLRVLFTLKSVVAKFFVGFGIGYAGVIACGGSVAVMIQMAKADGDLSWTYAIPFAFVVVIAVAAQWWANRRMTNTEFGRLV